MVQTPRAWYAPRSMLQIPGPSSRNGKHHHTLNTRTKDYLPGMLPESRWLHHEHRLVFCADEKGMQMSFQVPSACTSTILSLGVRAFLLLPWISGSFSGRVKLGKQPALFKTAQSVSTSNRLNRASGFGASFAQKAGLRFVHAV